MKKYVCFGVFPLQTCLLLRALFQPHLICETQFYQNCHTAKASSISEHIFNIWKPIQKLVLYYGKVKEAYFTSVNKAQRALTSCSAQHTTEVLNKQIFPFSVPAAALPI